MLGEELDLLIIDEAANISQKIWFDYLLPTTASKTRQGKTIFISTPRGKNWFYDLYIKAKEITDPWGRPFLYHYSGTGVPTVTTLGADGVTGVTSDGADEDYSIRPAIGPGAFPPAWRPLTTQKTQGPTAP